MCSYNATLTSNTDAPINRAGGMGTKRTYQEQLGKSQAKVNPKILEALQELSRVRTCLYAPWHLLIIPPVFSSELPPSLLAPFREGVCKGYAQRAACAMLPCALACDARQRVGHLLGMAHSGFGF